MHVLAHFYVVIHIYIHKYIYTYTYIHIHIYIYIFHKSLSKRLSHSPHTASHLIRPHTLIYS